MATQWHSERLPLDSARGHQDSRGKTSRRNGLGLRRKAWAGGSAWGAATSGPLRTYDRVCGQNHGWSGEVGRRRRRWTGGAAWEEGESGWRRRVCCFGGEAQAFSFEKDSERFSEVTREKSRKTSRATVPVNTINSASYGRACWPANPT